MSLYRILAGAAAGIMLLGLIVPYFGLGSAHHTYDVTLPLAFVLVFIALCCGLCTAVYRFVKALL
jgi:hypothetical protein